MAILAILARMMGDFIGFLTIFAENDRKSRKNGHFRHFVDKIGTYSPCSGRKVSRDTSGQTSHPGTLKLSEKCRKNVIFDTFRPLHSKIRNSRQNWLRTPTSFLEGTRKRVKNGDFLAKMPENTPVLP